MNRILLFLLSLLLSNVATQAAKQKYPGAKRYIYRYYLRDKVGCGYSTDHPSRFLSPKSIERRKRQHLRVDSTDLPVSNAYIDRFRVRGVTILGSSRWNNTLLVGSQDTTLLHLLAQLPCVVASKHVWTSPDSIDNDRVKMHFRDHFNQWDSLRGDPMGMARKQIEMLGGDRLHEVDLRGQGITIAVLDGGFQNVNVIPCFKKTRILGLFDFVERPTGIAHDNFFQGIDHGTKVFSALAAQAPEVMAGTAPEASYWLLKCEDPTTEMPIEEDYWAMAAEFADSVGVDIISSSLGYNEFDSPFANYHLRDLDGHTALISHTASLLADKGIVLCNSAGNSGMTAWKKITVPADATDILTVGAVNEKRQNAAFASVGPSHDGRVKPDVVALGSGTSLISGRGTLVHDMGTSFSTPIVTGLVACLWQGLPQKTAKEIISLVQQSSSQYDEPDNVLGYGLPDFWQAYMIGITQ